MSSISIKFLVFMICVSSFQFITISSIEFEVGNDKGWVIPSAKDDKGMYNTWASKNRFKVNDTLHFKYGKDSVLEVTQEEYGKCRSIHPLFFSNNGDTVFTFDRPGYFFFISGVSGHCERGQQMVIKVLEPETPPCPPESSGVSSRIKSDVVFLTAVGMIIMSLLG